MIWEQLGHHYGRSLPTESWLMDVEGIDNVKKRLVKWIRQWTGEKIVVIY
jgi:hypothetical protein